MAAGYLEQAAARLKSAKRALKEKNYPYTVRQAQECVELSLKGILRLYGVEYPREHNVKEVLLQAAGRFPVWFRRHVNQFAEISARMAAERGPSMYGDEEKGIPPSELFGRERAAAAVAEAEMVRINCAKALDAFMRKAKRAA